MLINPRQFRVHTYDPREYRWFPEENGYYILRDLKTYKIDKVVRCNEVESIGKIVSNSAQMAKFFWKLKHSKFYRDPEALWGALYPETVYQPTPGDLKILQKLQLEQEKYFKNKYNYWNQN